MNFYGEKCTVSDLGDLSKTLAEVVVSDVENDLLEYDKFTNPLRIRYETKGLVAEYVEAINKLDANGKLVGEFDDIKECCFELKKKIDSYMNHVCDADLRARIEIIKFQYDKRERDEKENHRKEAEHKVTASLNETDRLYTNRFSNEYKRAKGFDDITRVCYVKFRQYLRHKIYEYLSLNTNMTGKAICEHINRDIKNMDAEIVHNVIPVEYLHYDKKFHVDDIYAEWNDVKAQMKDGTFGQNYPDNVPDDFDEALKYLKENGFNVYHEVEESQK